MRYTSKRFDLDSPLELPNALTYRNVNGRHLYIAPLIPAWVVLDDIAQRLMDLSISGETFRSVIEHLIEEFALAEDEALHKVKELITLLHDRDFYNSRYSVVDGKVYSVMNMQFHLTNRCNLRCIHCYMDSGNLHYDEMSIEEWKNIIDVAASNFPIWHCTLSGGEPMLYKGWYEILQYAKERGAATAMITNGLLINEGIAEKLSEVLDHIQVSVDGGSASINDEIRGRGTYEAAFSALKLLIKTRLRVGINVTIMKENYDDIRENLFNLNSRSNYTYTGSFTAKAL